MGECGVLHPIFPEATLLTVSWPWTVTLTLLTFRSHVGRYSRICQSFSSFSRLWELCTQDSDSYQVDPLPHWAFM